MTESQPMKLMEIVSDYPIAEEENLRHIDKTKEPSEDATKQLDTDNASANASPTDPQKA